MSTIKQFDKGDAVRVAAVFGTTAVPVDPDAVIFEYYLTGNSTTTLTYGVDAALVKDSTGHYHVDIDAATAGTWYWRFHSTGNGQAADEGSFKVNSSKF